MQPERFCVYVFSVAEDGIEASVSERVGVWQGLTFEEGTMRRASPGKLLVGVLQGVVAWSATNTYVCSSIGLCLS